MANRYKYQFQGGIKAAMTNIEGFVSIGTGGLLNTAIPYPSPTGGAVATSTYWGTLPGQLTAGVPTGWVGAFSGTWGLYGAGVAGVARIATGLYSIQLSDDYVRIDSCQIEPVVGAVQLANGGVTGANPYSANVSYFTVGVGNSVTTGAISQSNATGVTNTVGMSGLVGQNLKNQVLVQFSNLATGASGVLAYSSAADLPLGAGFFVALRLRDTTSQPGCQ